MLLCELPKFIMLVLIVGLKRISNDLLLFVDKDVIFSQLNIKRQTLTNQ